MEKTQETQLIELLVYKYVEEKYGLKKEDLDKLIARKTEKGIPLEVLRVKELSNLEAIVKYLRENQGMTYAEISKKMHRAQGTLASTYKKAKTKKTGPLNITGTETIPFSAFKPGQSILGSICLYLKGTGLKNVEIARKLEKNPRTIWTTLKREKNE